jgi:hypothetical protein
LDGDVGEDRAAEGDPVAGKGAASIKVYEVYS